MRSHAPTPAAYAEFFAIGLLAGLRSMAGPLRASQLLASRAPRLPDDSLARLVAEAPVPQALQLLAGGEMLADKLPFMPDRTAPVALGGRLALGALAGVLVAESWGGGHVAGAVLGALGAAASSYAGLHARRWATERLRAPSQLAGMVEDLIVIWLGSRLAHGLGAPQVDGLPSAARSVSAT